ncbi:VOC family protein [Ferruginibacter sp.]
MFNKLRTVIYYVPDMQQAKEWYVAVTGIQPYFDEPFYIGFDINGHELGLHPVEGEQTKGNQTVAYWAVNDIKAVVAALLAKGAALYEQVTDTGGGIKVATVTDPWGNAVGLIEGA